MSDTGTQFAGSIPQIYERDLVPLIFDPYARDLATRVAALQPARVLEIAAGTGVVTRQLASALRAKTRIVATDLNPPMLEQAKAAAIERPIEWRQADAMQLPFDDGAFDVVVCQFGAMFFPEKAVAYGEFRRVLREGGWLIFNVWDKLEENEFAFVIAQALAARFPQNPPTFLSRLPYAYYDLLAIGSELADAQFQRSPEFTTVTERSRAETARIPAVGFCEGTPLRTEIEANDPSGLTDAVEVATAAVAERFGTGPVDGKIQAHVVAVQR